MKDNGSEKVLDLYIKANENKNKIVFDNKGDEYSEAEMVVLSCLAMVVREQEDEDKSINYDRVIKTIILNSLDGKLDGLKRKEEYQRNIDACRELEDEEAFGASTVYERMVNGFGAYLDPVYTEELFVNRNLKLHERKRKGHIYWGAKTDRLENILEHIYGCLVLSIGLESEYGYDVDYNKIRKMLIIHETGEIIIGDQTEWDLPKEEKERIEREAVVKLLSSIPNGEKLIKLLDEFNGHISLESEYAYLIDKIEYDMQVKMYEKEGKYDFGNIPVNVVTTSKSVQDILQNGATGVFDVHYEYDKEKYNRIPCFRRILEKTKNY